MPFWYASRAVSRSRKTCCRRPGCAWPGTRAACRATPSCPWLFTVARNLYISHRRWALLDPGRLRELGLLPAGASQPNPHQDLLTAEQVILTNSLMGAVPAIALHDAKLRHDSALCDRIHLAVFGLAPVDG